MFLAVAAQAQTDTSSGTASTAPTLTISASRATATEGDEVTYTVTAGSAPSSALPVVVHVRAHGEVMDTRTVAEVFLPAGATTVTLRLEEFTDEIAESPVNVTLTLAAGAGYSVGDPSEATVSIDYPSISGTQATPTPTPAVSPPDAPSDVSISATTINSFTVIWTAETDKTYRVEREAAFLFSYRVWQTVSNDLSSGSFTESGLPCGLYYLFQVRAKVTGSAYGDGTKKLGHSQSCPSTTSAGSRNTRDHVDPPKLRVVTDNPTEDKIQIRLLLFGPTGNEEQYTSIPASLSLTDFQVDRSKRVVGSNPKEWPDSGTDLNTNYRKTRQVAEFDWTGLECGASYHFRARSGKRTVSSNQSTVVWGHWSDDASATPMIVSLSMSVHGSTRGCPQLAVPDVTIIPLPQRKALLQWKAVTGASGYVVQIQKKGQDWTRTATPTPETIDLTGNSSTSHNIELKDIYNGEGLAHDADGFEFRVMAKHSDSNRNSDFSADIVIRDGPSVTVNGHSSSGTTAVVKWKPPMGAKEYFVRWRKIDDSNQDHTSATWQLNTVSFSMSAFEPSNPTSTSLPSSLPATVEHTINGLSLGALYAVQVVYRTDDGWVYSARDAYVWTSTTKPGLGQRVAGYPYHGHLAGATYRYRICKNTFDTDGNTWALMIEHALMQWQKATNGLVSMVPEHDTNNPNHTPTSPEYEPCTEYTSVFQAFLLSIIQRERSEIRMLELPTTPPSTWVSTVSEIASDLLKYCLIRIVACVSPAVVIGEPVHAGNRYVHADITFNKRQVEVHSLSPAVPSDVVFNSCVVNATRQPNEVKHMIDGTSDQYGAYAITVHEGGHVLGIGGIEIDITTFTALPRGAHPSTGDSVLNYIWSEPDCAPHPLDIMAILALYQSP